MKKQVALAVAAALSLSVAGTALAAPANPFVDVPANHWAYDALASLQKDGVVTGYGDGTFRGDRNLTRYEMAAMVAKITNVDDKNAPLIKRLQSEFATELYNLGVRVDKLEKNASTIKFTGDARIRYQAGGNPDADAAKDSRWQERVRINMTADVNDNVKFFGRVVAINQSNGRDGETTAPATSTTGELYFDRAEFAWTKNNWGVSAGRMLPKLGQGIFAWNDGADGVIASYSDGKFSALAGILDVSYAPGARHQAASRESLNVSLAQLGYNFTDRIGMTAMYANGHGEDANLKPWAIGANIGFTQDLALRGEYIHNSDADDNKSGWFTRLTYGKANMKKVGSFEVYAEYLKFGEQSGAIAGNGSFFDAYQLAGNGTDNGDVKGWGLGVTYVLGKNHNMQLFYHDLKQDSTGDKLKKQYTIATNFLF